MQPYEYKNLNPATLLDSVFDIYKKTFFKQLAFSAIIGAVSFFSMFILAFIIGIAAAIPLITATDNIQYIMLVMMIIIFASILPLALIWSATTDAGHIILSQQAFYGMPVRLPIKHMPKMVLRVISVMLAQLTVIIPWLFFIIFFAVLIIRSGDFSIMDANNTFLPAMSGAPWIILAIGGALTYIIYSNIFALATPAAIFEKKIFFTPLVRSWRLIKNDFWMILGIRLIWAISVYILTYSAQGLWFAFFALFNNMSGGGSLTMTVFIGFMSTMMQSLITIGIGFAVGPLSGILTALLYFRQRINNEGADIEIMLARQKYMDQQTK